jgi:hypothetical protein
VPGQPDSEPDPKPGPDLRADSAPPGLQRPPLVPTGRHGGRLYAGGVPGNRGGRGRPPKVVLQEVDEDLAAALLRLRKAVKNERTATRDVVQIARFYAELKAAAMAAGGGASEQLIAVLSKDEEQMAEHLAEFDRQGQEGDGTAQRGGTGGVGPRIP